MNIQPSLIVWTVICFCLLLLILKKLLYDPLLRCMDQREARIAASQAHLRELEAVRLLAVHAAEEDQRQQREAAEKALEQRLSAAQAEAREALSLLQAEEDAETLRFQAALPDEERRFLAGTAEEAEKLGNLFSDRLTT